MALNFRLFNCDRTFSLDKVEALIQRVAAKLSRETKIEKTYFPLPRMKDLCEELEKEDSHFEYAVFVVHAHESRLSINEKNAGIGYAKVYRALQKVTGDRVLVVIGGDDNYKDQGERDKSVLSRWVWHKLCSQFTEDYVNGVKGFIFSWEENHHPIHEEALEFYLDPTKRGTQFVPRPKPPPAKVPEKEETKKTKQAKLLEEKKQEPHPMETKKFLEKELPNHDPLQKKQEEPKTMEIQTLENEFPPGNNENRKLPSDPGNQTMNRQVQSSQQYPTQLYHSKPIEAAQGKNTNELLVVSFYSRKESVSKVENLIINVCKEFGINSWPSNPFWNPNSLPQEILKNKPGYLVLVSEFDEFRAELSSSHDNQIYLDIVKNSKDVGTKLIFVVTEDSNYRATDMSSDVVHSIFTKLNQSIPSSEQPMVMSWNKTPWTAHRDALVQLLTPPGSCQTVRAAPQQYGAAKQDPTSRVPCTQPGYVPVKRRFYRASISNGRVVQVLGSDPLGWEPDTRYLNDLLMKNRSVKKGTIEFWDEGDGRGLQSVVRTCEAKLYKIAEGVDTQQMHSILVYSYHVEEETNEIITNFIHHLDILELLPRVSIDPSSLMHEINGVNPDYVMFSADINVLKDDDKVKKLIRDHGTRIRDIIENNVGRGVIIMLFGDKYNEQGEILASKEATQYVRKLTKGIVKPDKLTVMTCQDKPYIAHQNRMKELLKPDKDPDKGLLRYKADVVFGRVDKVSYIFPQDWQPEEFILKDVLEKSKKEEKVTLEFWEDKNGQINPIVTAPSKGLIGRLPSIPIPFPSIPSLFSSKEKKKSDKSDVV